MTKLEASFDRVGNRFNDASLNLQILQEAMDNKLIGHYLQVKMEALTSSPIFCEAQKSCANTDKPLSNPNLEKLFSRDLPEKPDKSKHK